MTDFQIAVGIASIVSAVIAIVSIVIAWLARGKVNKFVELHKTKITSGGMFINPIIDVDELNISLVVKENLGSDEIGGKMEP